MIQLSQDAHLVERCDLPLKNHAISKASASRLIIRCQIQRRSPRFEELKLQFISPMLCLVGSRSKRGDTVVAADHIARIADVKGLRIRKILFTPSTQ